MFETLQGHGLSAMLYAEYMPKQTEQLRDFMWHTLVLDYLVPILIHGLHDILEHIVGIFQSWRQIRY
jgi:hypothetical protein